jgi:hypothetical protein
VRTTTSGLLLLLIGIAALAGFLTGNLDRWMGYLFDPSRPTLAGAGGLGAGRVGSGSWGAPSTGGTFGERRAT